MKLSESLTQYNQLISNISELELPQVNGANISLQTQLVAAEQLETAITTFSPSQGWVQYSDELVISSKPPVKNNILEAQFCNDNENSLHIKLQQGSQYLVTTLTKETESTVNQYYTEQTLVIRQNLKEHATYANYRLWFQLETQGHNEGRWLPIAQQFIGFDTTKNKEVN
jgi:hypothetical protein